MLKFSLFRTINYAWMLFIATSLAYFMASAFLDPRSNYVNQNPTPPPEAIDAALTAANMNDKIPLLERYWTWLQNVVLSWNWGLSPEGASINGEMARRMLVSTQLVFLATFLSIIIGVGLGIWAAIHHYKLRDRIINAFSVASMVMPVFVLALLIVLVAVSFNDAIGVTAFYVTGLSESGVNGFFPSLLDWLRHITLPTLAMTGAGWYAYHQTQRTYLLDTINADYVRTARAKGLEKSKAIRRHALRPSLIPTATGVAFSITTIFTGAVFIEQIFAIPGLGQYFIQTINQNNVNGAVAVAAFGGACTLAGALLADIVIAWLDPRIRIN
ncbi:ABC transporter permease [Arthrobacter pigmenti]